MTIKINKNRKTSIEKYGKDDFGVIWCDGSVSYYKTLDCVLEAIKKDFEDNG